MATNVVRMTGESLNIPAPCSKCGADTQSKSGVCRACHNGYGLPDPKTLTVEKIAAYMATLRVELKRRQAEIAKALGGES